MIIGLPVAARRRAPLDPVAQRLVLVGRELAIDRPGASRAHAVAVKRGRGLLERERQADRVPRRLQPIDAGPRIPGGPAHVPDRLRRKGLHLPGLGRCHLVPERKVVVAHDLHLARLERDELAHLAERRILEGEEVARELEVPGHQLPELEAVCHGFGSRASTS
jgi:hypothetical protein